MTSSSATGGAGAKPGDRAFTEIRALACPFCDAMIDGLAPGGLIATKRGPQAGDYGVCVFCSQITVVAGAGESLRLCRPDRSEMQAAFAAQPVLGQLMHDMQAAVRSLPAEAREAVQKIMRDKRGPAPPASSA